MEKDIDTIIDVDPNDASYVGSLMLLKTRKKMN